jgi:hypothetical protein
MNSSTEWIGRIRVPGIPQGKELLDDGGGLRRRRQRCPIWFSREAAVMTAVAKTKEMGPLR